MASITYDQVKDYAYNITTEAVAAKGPTGKQHPVFTTTSIQALLRAVEREQKSFGLMFGMYLGVPTLQVIKLQEKYADKTNDTVEMGEIIFREWFNKRTGKLSEKYKDVLNALNNLNKGLYAEIFQQKYLDDLPMGKEDFQIIQVDEDLANPTTNY